MMEEEAKANGTNQQTEYKLLLAQVWRWEKKGSTPNNIIQLVGEHIHFYV